VSTYFLIPFRFRLWLVLWRFILFLFLLLLCFDTYLVSLSLSFSPFFFRVRFFSFLFFPTSLYYRSFLISRLCYPVFFSFSWGTDTVAVMVLSF